jgi:hypothetical protein
VRSEILDKHPATQLRVYVVWFDMLPGEARQMVDLQILADRRATNYWDESRITGRWFSDHVVQDRGITWDTYFFYGPNARWETTPEPLLSSGAPVIGGSEDLAAAAAPFLKAS